MSTLLRHDLLDDGRVLIAIGGPNPSLVRVAAHEAKRFAWGLLSDLDPDGVEEEQERLAPSPANNSADPFEKGEQMRLIVGFLAGRADATTNDIAAFIQRSGSHTAVQLGRLATLGLVTRLAPGRSFSPGIWAIGPISIEEHKRRLMKPTLKGGA